VQVQKHRAGRGAEVQLWGRGAVEMQRRCRDADVKMCRWRGAGAEGLAEKAHRRLRGAEAQRFRGAEVQMEW